MKECLYDDASLLRLENVYVSLTTVWYGYVLSIRAGLEIHLVSLRDLVALSVGECGTHP